MIDSKGNLYCVFFNTFIRRLYLSKTEYQIKHEQPQNKIYLDLLLYSTRKPV